MQTTPGRPTAYRQTFPQDPGHDRGVGIEPLTPAERIALTIALLNRGLDLMDGVARKSLAGCARGAFRGHHDSAQGPHSVGTG
jgi:hypothetical protein